MQTIYQEEVEESSKKSFLGREKIKINGQKSSIIIANRWEIAGRQIKKTLWNQFCVIKSEAFCVVNNGYLCSTLKILNSESNSKKFLLFYFDHNYKILEFAENF